jgi:IclR family acetate operon transcriptional repressor
MAVKTIQSVENALLVMETLASVQPIGVSALARLVDLDKNAVQRILITLGHAGWIRQGDSGEWQITSRAFQIGTRYTAGLRDAARPHLEVLQHDTGETVLLMAREGLSMVVVDAIDSAHALRMTVPIGTVVPLSAAGAFDTFLSDADQEHLVNVQPMAGRPRTLSKRAIANVRAAGFYVLDDMYPSSMAAGAPVFSEHNAPIASVTVVGPRARVSKPMAHHFGELAAATAAAIGASLGVVR